MADANIHTEARVLAHLHGPLYQVSLPNGKIILAHLSKQLADQRAVFQSDTQLLVELTPFDFNQARILGTLPAATNRG